ncbi:tetratricopeptide repeat protein [Micromonospora antibiotica]|uniref:Tetratricopeptide repeat protein n=1 Tax=Micromonospora antibiotica TaxID=2807623 RepID=A0ABS3V776_9ACTN|nr:tetratricopeptide repeat protein [Micromonospora antibiotica]MBO4161431.1 tetratricopeptide repeat protein [Micromonospora antibiotica]
MPEPVGGSWSAGGQRLDGVVAFGDVIMVSGVRGDVTITTGRPPYRVEEFPAVVETVTTEQARQRPSRLLLAQHRVVPFVGRDDDLAEVAQWMGRPGGVLVRLLHAAGGQGKTRLAGHVADVWAKSGWTVWRVLHEPVYTGGYRMDLPAGGALLVVVDYADRWPVSHLQSLLTHLKSMNVQTSVTVRVLLLARSTTAWWPALRNRLRSDHQVEATSQLLPPLGGQVDGRVLFRQARDRFAIAMDVAAADRLPPPNLADETFRQVLSVHMAALVAVDAHRRNTTAPTDPHALSSYLLERERDHWYALHHRPVEPRQTPPEVMGRTVYLATLTAAVSRATATDLLHRVGLTAPAATTIIDDHRFCYPPEDHHTVFQALHPDRLGEDLIALSTPGHQHTDDEDGWDSDDWAVTAVEHLLRVDTDPPPWAAHAVTVLVETARRWDHVATDILYPVLRRHPHLALAAGGTTITRLATIPGIDPDVLDAIDAVLPTHRHVDLDIAAAAVTTALTPHRLAATTDPAEHARLHTIHARRLANAGLRDQALPLAEESAGIYRRLAGANPAAYLPALASSLNDLGLWLWGLGRREEALAPSEEAAAIYRRLAGANPAAYLPALAMSLNNLGLWLSGLGRREEALAPSEEAAAIYRRLVEVDPAAYLPDLAMSLNNLGTVLSELRRWEEALLFTEEALMIRRRLVEANPAAYLPALAMSLHDLGFCLSGLGRREEALPFTEEALTIRWRLMEANPAAYLPDLAMSLINLGDMLSGLGRRGEALAPSVEAVGIYRRLVEANPAAYLPYLAASLNNLGVQLSEVGRRGEALPPSEEATAIYRRLVEVNPAAYLPDLAMSLNNLGVRLSELGRRGEALAPSAEAVGIYRRLVEANPAAYLPELARSVNNLGLRLSEVGWRGEALALSGEAVGIFRRLVEANPAAYLPALAMSLNNLGTILLGLGRREEALAPSEEGTGIYRRLVEVNPAAYLPALAMSLNNLGVCLSGLGRREKALALSKEAVMIRRRLAEANPTAYLPDLTMSVNNLSIRLSELGRWEEALALNEEATVICRRLAEANPAAYLPDLASSSLAYGRLCVTMQANFTEALEAVTEAVNIYERLTEQLPAVFAERLFAAYQTLANVLDGLGRVDEAAELRRQLDEATAAARTRVTVALRKVLNSPARR